MLTFTNSIEQNTRSLSQSNVTRKRTPKKETKTFKFKKEEFKLSLFTANMIFYRENPNIPQKNNSVQFSAVTQSCPTLCDSMNCSKPGLPVCHQLLEFTQTSMAPHSSTLAWKIPWIEESGRLQSMGSLRVGHD